MLLKDNPFYILDVSLSSNRRKIAEASDEIGFLLGAEKSSEAQSILTNPGKRLYAELSWFPEASETDIAFIRTSVANDQPITLNTLTGYSRLNALIYNFGITEYLTAYDLGFDIVGIDEQYTAIDISEITKIINQARESAGISAVSESEVQDCHRKVVEDVRKLINEKLKPFDEKSYIEFVTIIAEQYIADKQYDAGPVLFDIVDQYEIRMQSELDNKTNQIKQYIDLIKAEQDNDVIKKSVSKLIERVKAWDVYAQPLQLRSQASGMPHETSRDLATELRGLCLYLNNEKNLTSEAKELASAMRSVFVELGELNEIFSDDTKKLTEIEKNNQDAERVKEIEQEFKAIERDVNSFGNRDSNRNTVILKNKVIALDKKIRESHLSPDLERQLRTGLCYMVRKGAIDLNNNLHDPSTARLIIKDLFNIFQDLTEPREKLAGDLVSLDKNLNQSRYANMLNTSGSSYKQKSGWRGKAAIVWLVMFALVFILSRACNNNSSKTSGSSYSSGSSYRTSTSTKSTSKPTAKPTAKPTTKPEKEYSAGTSAFNDRVFVNITLIEPQYGIYTVTNGKSVMPATKYHHYVCKCTTDAGKTVWVSFPSDDYRSKIDSSVDIFVNSSSSGFNGKSKRFTPAACIHGKVVTANSVMKDLEDEIGENRLIEYSSIDIPKQSTIKKETISIETIFPSYPITSGSNNKVTHVLCEFTDSQGRKNWIYMSVDAYNRYFDSSVNLEKDTTADTKVFIIAKKVTVTTQYADDLVNGASKKIGQEKVYVFSGIN